MTSSPSWELPSIVDYFDDAADAPYRLSRQLEAMSSAEQDAALRTVTETVRRRLDELDDDQVARAAVLVVDHMYRAASAAQVWDSPLAAYLEGSARPFFEGVARRGFLVHYLVDNTYSDLGRPVELYPHWYGRCGIAYSCPQLMARRLMEADGAAADFPARLPQYIGEGRRVADLLVERAAADDQHFVFLDADAAEHAFATAQRVSEAPGVIFVFRNKTPAEASSCLVRLPDGPRPVAGL